MTTKNEMTGSINNEIKGIELLTSEQIDLFNQMESYPLNLGTAVFDIKQMREKVQLVISEERQENQNADSRELQERINAIDELIKNPHWIEYVQHLKSVKAVLENCLNNPEVWVKNALPLFGRFVVENGQPTAIIYIENIKAWVNKFEEGQCHDDAMIFMPVYMYVHLMMHAFFYLNRRGEVETVREVEEAMAEFGTLVFLDSISQDNHSLRQLFLFTKVLVIIKSKCVGLNACYGMGYYLFENCPNKNLWLTTYAQRSHSISINAEETIAYVAMVYPKIAYESVAMNMLKWTIFVEIEVKAGAPYCGFRRAVESIGVRYNYATEELRYSLKGENKNVSNDIMRNIFNYVKNRRNIEYFFNYAENDASFMIDNCEGSVEIAYAGEKKLVYSKANNPWMKPFDDLFRDCNLGYRIVFK